MFQNYLKIAYRNLMRYFGYTVINVFGLAVGLATAIFIFLWVLDEYSYDNFHVEGELLYKVMNNSRYADGTIETYPTTPAPLMHALKKEVPEVAYAVRTTWGEKMLMEYHGTSLLVLGMWADPQLFKAFTFPVILGNKENPLPNINSIAISRSIADKYFPGENPLGKIFKVDERFEVIVSAVFEDVPRNSSMAFDFVMPFEVYFKENTWLERWGNFSIQTYVKLHSGASVRKVNKQMKAIKEKNCKECMGTPVLHAYRDGRLYSYFENGKVSGGRIEYVRVFIAVGIFILVIACVNFMNLATARVAIRSKEVGVRKVIGARRKHLILQFMGEAFFMGFIAFLLGILLVEILLPSFNLLTDKKVVLDFSQPVLTIGLLGITLLTSFISGIYPAIFLSSFKPATIFKRNHKAYFSGASLRKCLVVFQFSISIILVVGATVVYHQTSFIQEKNLGFDKENIITFDLGSGIRENIETFKSEALRYAGVKAVAASGQMPFNIENVTTDPDWPGKPEGKEVPFKVITCDHDFIPTLNMQVVEGRNFSSNYDLDSNNYMVNEAAVKVMGLENPVGTPLDMWMGKGEIIGVVKDFHNQNFREAIVPLIFTNIPVNTWKVYVRLEGRDTRGAISHLKELYQKFEPVYPFEYTFLNEDFNRQYESETTLEKLMVYFTIVAILISCLGLFGLTAFTSQQRTKEVGIRKVLGASLSNIAILLSGDFIKLVMVAIVIALPISWAVMENWLENYAYRITIKPGYLVAAGLVALIIALFTVSYQSIKAALANPVDSLKNE